jgi:hypothetical protein
MKIWKKGNQIANVYQQIPSASRRNLQNSVLCILSGFILYAVTIRAFRIFCKTPGLKTDANRFIGKTVCVHFKFLAFYKSADDAGGNYIYAFSKIIRIGSEVRQLNL